MVTVSLCHSNTSMPEAWVWRRRSWRRAPTCCRCTTLCPSTHRPQTSPGNKLQCETSVMSNTDMLACCEIHKHYLKSRKWSVWSIFNKQFFFFKTVRCWVFIHVGSCIVRYLEQHLSKQPKLIHLRLIWHTGMVRERLIWQRVDRKSVV